jgi:AraC-like DNA-binding protein
LHQPSIQAEFANMPAYVNFQPQTIAWWTRLMEVGQRLGRVHRWTAAEHGPSPSLMELQQHATDTLVVCLSGTARIVGARCRLDLSAGDALVLRPGAWHHHANLRTGGLVYQQGVFAGFSDFLFASPEMLMFANWPEQPARRMLSAVGTAEMESDRRQHLRSLICHLRTERACSSTGVHPATTAMEMAMWHNLHRPDCLVRVLAASRLGQAQAYRLFRHRWKCGIATLIRQSRLQLAHQLLSDGMTVVNVAERTGIRDRSVFSRAFRRQWGVSPSQLQRKEQWPISSATILGA